MTAYRLQHDASIRPLPETVDVWAVRLDLTSPPDERMWSLLSPGERDRAAAFRLEEPRRQFVAARAASRVLLGRCLGTAPEAVFLENDAHGKPRLGGAHAKCGLHFNVAHSSATALVALAVDCPVGVDVERVRRVTHAEQIARRFFHPVEVEAVLSAPASERDAAFLRCWTGKEAVLKAVGVGIAGSLSSFCVPREPSSGAWIGIPAITGRMGSRCWLLQFSLGQEYLGAVACLDADRRVRLLQFQD